jgi:hypothetical protein
MANLQVKKIPDALHRTLADYARREGRTLRDLVLAALEREVARRAFRERLATRDAVDLGRPAARAVEEARRVPEEGIGT